MWPTQLNADEMFYIEIWTVIATQTWVVNTSAGAATFVPKHVNVVHMMINFNNLFFFNQPIMMLIFYSFGSRMNNTVRK